MEMNRFRKAGLSVAVVALAVSGVAALFAGPASAAKGPHGKLVCTTMSGSLHERHHHDRRVHRHRGARHRRDVDSAIDHPAGKRWARPVDQRQRHNFRLADTGFGEGHALPWVPEGHEEESLHGDGAVAREVLRRSDW